MTKKVLKSSRTSLKLVKLAIQTPRMLRGEDKTKCDTKTTSKLVKTGREETAPSLPLQDLVKAINQVADLTCVMTLILLNMIIGILTWATSVGLRSHQTILCRLLLTLLKVIGLIRRKSLESVVGVRINIRINF